MEPAAFTFAQVKKQTTGLFPRASEVMFKLCEIKEDCLWFLRSFLSSGVEVFSWGGEVQQDVVFSPKETAFSALTTSVTGRQDHALFFKLIQSPAKILIPS